MEMFVNYTHESFPTPMASKFFPLRVRLSCRIGTASRLINLADGSGEPSTQPFQPFLTAMRFFRWRSGVGGLRVKLSSSSSSSGVCGLLEEVLDVLDDMEGPGVEPDQRDVMNWGDDGGDGVTENERCMAGMWIVGRLEEAVGCELEPAIELLEAACAAGNPPSSLRRLSSTLASSLCFRFLSLSFCLFSIFFLCLSSSLFSTT